MIDAFRLALGLAFLAIAAIMDVRTRKVPNRLWFIMFFTGILVLEIGYIFDKAPQVLLLTPIPAMIVFIVIFTEGEIAEDSLSKGANIVLTIVLVLVAIAVIYYQGMSLAYDLEWKRTLHIPIMIALAYVFYIARVLHGGADAKALMCLVVMVPFYPQLGSMPLIPNPELMTVMFPFAFVILLDSALGVLLVPLGYAVFNATRGDMDKRMFFGYRMPLKDVPKKFVWLMEKVVDGKNVTVLFPKRSDDKRLKKDLKALKEAGVKMPWVTPKLPFMVPMFVGYLLAFVVGNLIMGLVNLLVPA